MKQSKTDVIRAFAEEVSAKGSNLLSTGDKLIYYGTCIAQHYEEDIILNMTEYNHTINNLQVSFQDFNVIPVFNVPEGTEDLIPFYNGI